MKLFIFYFLYGVIAIALQSTWLAHFPSNWVRIDFVTLAVLFLAIHSEQNNHWFYIVLLALLSDVASYVPFGTGLIIYPTTFLIIRWFLRRVALQNYLSQFVWVFVFSVLHQLCSNVLIQVFLGYNYFSLQGTIQLLGQALWNSGCGFLLFPLLRKMHHTSVQDWFKPKGITLRS